MSFQILETVIDLSGNKRVQVKLSDTETLILKFKNDPSPEEIDLAVAAYQSSPVAPPPEPIEILEE
jgi:hypothetical protein